MRSSFARQYAARFFLPLVVFSAFFLFHPGLKHALPPQALYAADKNVDWKLADQPMLRVNDRPVADEWNVYQPGKKTNPLLVKMGPRFLLVDGHDRRIYEVPADQVTHKGPDLRWDSERHPGKVLETSDWIVKDVGLAYRISARLVAENRVIDVQIPHPMDIRPLETR